MSTNVPDAERVFFDQTVEILRKGGRIVIGADKALDEGLTIRSSGEVQLVVKRRATREEFLECAPGPSEHITAPFYYELEYFDQVLEREDGERLGLRVRERGVWRPPQ